MAQNWDTIFDYMYNLSYSTLTMKTVTASYARNNFQEIVNRALYKGESIVVVRRGKPVATVQPYRERVKRNRQKTFEPSLKFKKKVSEKEALVMFSEMKENYDERLP